MENLENLRHFEVAAHFPTLNLISYPNLVALNLINTNLIDLNFGPLLKLEEINIACSKVTKINLVNLIALKRFSLKHFTPQSPATNSVEMLIKFSFLRRNIS